MTYPDFDTIKNFYGMKLWTDDMVKRAVTLNVITADQFKEITGTDYVAPAQTKA